VINSTYSSQAALRSASSGRHVPLISPTNGTVNLTATSAGRPMPFLLGT
jgi:hypothetical protein